MKIVQFILEKQAHDPVVLNMSQVTHFCDYFVICSADTERQAKAIFEYVLREAKKNRIKVHHAEDDPSSRWMLIDLFDVILHIFDAKAREYFGIERIWREAKKITIPKSLTV